jgi:hypothetical protein
MDMSDLQQISGLSDALQNADTLIQNYNAQVSAQSAVPLPSLTQLEGLMKGNSPGTQLAGGKKAKSGGSKKSKGKKSRSSRSKRAELRQRYNLSPKKRGRRRKSGKK